MVFLSTVWVISILVVGGCSRAHADDGQAVSVNMGVKIPMRDGINLAATVYTPKLLQEPLPAIRHLRRRPQDRPQELTGSKPDNFMDVTYDVPAELTKGKQKMTVKFQAHPGAAAGGVYGCRIMKSGK